MEGLLQNTGPGHILVSHGVPSGVLCVCLCKRLCRHQKKQGNEVLRFPRRDSGLSRTSDSCQECPPVGTRLLSSPRIRKRTATVLVGLFFLRSASWNKAVKAGCSPEVIAHVGAEPRPKTEKEGCGRSRSWSARDQDDVSSAGAGPGRAVVPGTCMGPTGVQQPQKGLNWGDTRAGARAESRGTRRPRRPETGLAGDSPWALRTNQCAARMSWMAGPLPRWDVRGNRQLRSVPPLLASC